MQTVDSPVALRELTDNWPDAVQLGPAPAVWVPGSTMWGELLNARLGERHLPPMAPNGTPFARTPLVVAMPAAMAHALDYPQRPIGWTDLEQLARNPRGWGAYGHPEWGSFRLGKGSPAWSTTGLDETVALDSAPAAASGAKALEQSIVYYGDTTHPYFDNWQRLAQTSPARSMTYLSATITDERSVVAYNTGHEADDEINHVSPTGTPARPALRVVAIYPEDAGIESDNPIIVLDAKWSSPSARTGARIFTKYALQSATQAKVAAAGFRPARGAVDAKLLNPANGVDPKAHTPSVAPSSPIEIEQALTHWQSNRRPANVLVLFDVSDSMGDTTKTAGPPKITLARSALADAIDQLAPGDNIRLRIFTTKLPNPVSPDWLDVVPRGPFATRRPALRKAIAALVPEQGSPLYAATRAAYDTVAHEADAGHINAVIVLTDGYNEDDRDNNQRALLAHLAANPDIHVFTVTYGNSADLTTLRKIAQATNAWNYDARDTTDLADLLPRAFASF